MQTYNNMLLEDPEASRRAQLRDNQEAASGCVCFQISDCRSHYPKLILELPTLCPHCSIGLFLSLSLAQKYNIQIMELRE